MVGDLSGIGQFCLCFDRKELQLSGEKCCVVGGRALKGIFSL